MREKKGLKRIAFVALLAVAGLFSFASTVYLGQDSNQNVRKARADTEAIYETINDVRYRVIYFHVHSSWEYSNEFGSGNKKWRYLYSRDNGSSFSSELPFGNSDSYSFNEIIGDFAAKVYLPYDTTTIQFRSVSSSDYSGDKYNTKQESITTGEQAYWVTEDKYSSGKNSNGTWVSKDKFFNRFYTIYFSVASKWNGGEQNLTSDFVRCNYTSGSKYIDEEECGYFDSSRTRGSPITENMVFNMESGRKCAKFYVPKDCNEIWMATAYNYNDYGDVTTHTSLGTDDNKLFIVNSDSKNKNGEYGWAASGECPKQTVTYELYSSSSYVTKPTFARVYFSDPENNWPGLNNAVLGIQDLDGYYKAATSFSNTGVTSSYAATSFDATAYYYIDYPLANDNTTMYLKFKNGNNKDMLPVNKDSLDTYNYTGWLKPTFSPGYIYNIRVYGQRHQDTLNNNKWVYYEVDTIGYFGYFHNDGGTRNSGESYDYKEFRTSSTLLSAPTKDGYTFNGWYCGNDGFCTRDGGTYGASSPVRFKAHWIKNTQTVIAKDTVRIWIGYNGTTSSLFYKPESGAVVSTKIKINNYSYTATGTYYNFSEHIDGSDYCPRRYDYFDVPTSCLGHDYALNVERYKNNGTTWIGTSSFYTVLNSTYNDWGAFRILYCPSDWSGSMLTGGLSSSDSLFATVALCGMHTCSDVAAYGYTGFGKKTKDGEGHWEKEGYYSTFVQNSTNENGLSNYYIYDFESGDTSYSGDRTSLLLASQKYMLVDSMSSRNEMRVLGKYHNNLLPNVEADNTTLIIIVISSISLLSITALSILLVKKRKQK